MDKIELQLRTLMEELFKIANDTDNKELALGVEAMFDVCSKRVFKQLAVSNGIKALRTADKQSMIKGKIIQYRKKV